MCGINGIIAFENAPPVRQETLLAMRDSMVHRGPDGAGIWLDTRGRLGLAHRRLTILDSGPLAGQPMGDVAGTVVVVFNGEIYNHSELRRDLERVGHTFLTAHSDTEVLVNGYKAWGWAGLLQRVRGMFALALWDIRERCLYLARDRLGIKPLYIQRTVRGILFASEIKAILKVSDEPREVDAFAMYHYLSGMVAPAPMTMFRGIQKLPAASYLRISEDGEGSFHRYWHPATGDERVSLTSREDAVEYIRAAFSASVSEHMVADVPVGVLLSGGVDSTALLASMAGQGAAQIQTFSVGYEGYPELDERRQARDMAKRFGSRHHEVVISEASLMASWEDIVFHQDEPLADWVCFPLYHVAKLAAKDVKVVLVGEGADELFAGYDGYLRYLRLHRNYWAPYQRLIPEWLRHTIARMADGVAHGRIGGLAGIDFLIRASRDREFFWGGAATFWETQKHNLLTGDFFSGRVPARHSSPLDDEALRIMDSNVVMAAAASMLPSPSSPLTRMINLELHYRLPELLLMRVDKMTMAHSVEARVPFLDHRLVESVFDLPTDWKILKHRPKSLFKDAVRGLIPDTVIDRPKTGFGAPVSAWLRGELGRLAQDEIRRSPLFADGTFNQKYIQQMFECHREGRGDFGACLWTLFNLASWYNHWIVRS